MSPGESYAIGLKPDHAAAHMNLGNVLLQQNRLPEAIDSYRQVLAVEPRSPIAHYNIANVLASMGNRVPDDPDVDPEQDVFGMVAEGVDHAGLLALCCL